jgi:hypothetical protein
LSVRLRLLCVLMTAVLMLTGACATLQQIAALREVEFALDRISRLRLAGVELDGIRSASDVRPTDIARIAAAVATDDVPLEFLLHVRGENPESNSVDARLVALDWVLLLQDRETIRGGLDRAVVFPPGRPVDVPLSVRLDVADFVDGGARDLLELALSLAGAGGEPRDVALRATPTIETAIGPIRYPRPITIVSVRTGG